MTISNNNNNKYQTVLKYYNSELILSIISGSISRPLYKFTNIKSWEKIKYKRSLYICKYGLTKIKGKFIQ